AGCIARDTFIIQNRRKPVAGFEYVDTCENEYLKINNLSTSTTLSDSIIITFLNQSYKFGFGTSFTIPDTIPDGVYPVLFTITNSNGCFDTITKPVTINSVTYVRFFGLELDYCENQDTSLLIGSENGGVFSGSPFIEPTLPGRAIFKPTHVDSNIDILYSFTNTLGCTDSYTKTVDTVFAKPVLLLIGLDDAYCEKDNPAMLTINQGLANNSVFSVFRNGMKIDESTSLTYLFDPFLPGSYIIENFYTDHNGCFSEIQDSTVVNPLPNINLDSLVELTPGNTILVGNNMPDEPGVFYEWSNGDTSSFTYVDQPGIYLLYGLNNITQCEKSDTIEIKYDKNIKEVLFNIKIFPNPTTDKINISLSSPKNGIQLFRFNGNIVSINGISSFSTNLFGELILDIDNIESGYYCLKIPEVGDFFILKI
ncbi:MAG: T9SS type A sorting domain-containing protein, partial [Saprospiraceae bacterium]